MIEQILKLLSNLIIIKNKSIICLNLEVVN
nr:MAG TPA: hypothetical protein [Crassvirales sp.]